MTDETDVPALVGTYENGLYTFAELSAKLIEWSDIRSLDHLTHGLPGPLRERFVQEARRRYENAEPAEAFANLRDEGHIPHKRLADLRAWLARQP